MTDDPLTDPFPRSITVLFTYFMLCSEDYRWHWRSFTTGGGSALWLLLYGVFYWASRLSLDSLASVVLYIGYLSAQISFHFLPGAPTNGRLDASSLLLSLANFLLTGSIGFLASYFAIRRLYGTPSIFIGSRARCVSDRSISLLLAAAIRVD